MHAQTLSYNEISDRKKNEIQTNYEIIKRAIRINQYLLNSIGIWPIVSRQANRILQKIMIVVGNFVLAFAIVLCGLHMIYEQTDTTIRLKLFGLLSFCCTNVMKYGALALKRPDIARCIELMKTDWQQLGESTLQQVERQKNREVMIKYASMGRNITITCVCFMYSGGLIYHFVLPFTAGRIVDEYNETIRPLVYPIYNAFFDAQNSPVYELVYFAHCMCGHTMYAITSGACGLAAIFAMHACGQIEILMLRLKDLISQASCKNNAEINRQIAGIIQHHLKILKFLGIVEGVLQEVCFIEFTGSTFMICLLEYYCITDWEVGNTISLSAFGLLLVSFSFNIFILCYIGERLMEQTGQIGSKCFSTEWYLLPPNIARGLILLIAVSNHPVKLTAAQMADLSLSTFGNVIKTSVAYLSLLRNVL